MEIQKNYYVYVLRCLDNSLYTGITTDVERRFNEHSKNRKLGAKYTRSRHPVLIEAVWCCQTRSDASKLEYAFKKLTKPKKEQIISDYTLFNNIFSEIINTNIYNYISKYKGYSIIQNDPDAI